MRTPIIDAAAINLLCCLFLMLLAAKLPPQALATGVYSNCDGFCDFVAGDLERVNTAERLQTIVRQLNGTLDPNIVIGTADELLSSEERANLRKHVDRTLLEMIEEDDYDSDEGDDDGEEDDSWRWDFRLEVELYELQELISLDSLQRLHKAFQDYKKFPVSKVFIRRTTLQNDRHVQYHQDGPTSVMHVWLNDDEIQGGTLNYLMHNGTVVIDTAPGSAVLHADGLVHGINTFDGTRYILILYGEDENDDDMMAQVWHCDNDSEL